MIRVAIGPDGKYMFASQIKDAENIGPEKEPVMYDDLVEITNVYNKAFRTYQKAKEEGVYRLSPAEAFNELSHVPAKDIDLGDGRIVEITGWEPVGDIKYNGIGYIPVTIKGYIRRKPPTDE